MTRRGWTLVMVFWISACTSQPQGPGCPASDPARASRLYEVGRGQLAASRDGEHYRAGAFEVAMGTLREAAAAGSRDAQSLYGRTLFATLYGNAAPTPEERDAYVSALVALRRAARTGDEAARDFLPTWSVDAPEADRPPLDALPAAWLQAALEESQACP